MTQDQFNKLKDEHKERKIDPFELQVFHEETSAKLKLEQAEQKRQQAQREMETLSKAPSGAYQGFNKTKAK